MSGIGYDAEVIVYNRVDSGAGFTEAGTWYGQRLEKTRVELQQKETIGTDGTTAASTCTIKIHDSDLPLPVCTRPLWEAVPDRSITFGSETYILVIKKEDLNRNIEDAPEGIIKDSEYPSGLPAYLHDTYGMLYHVTTAEHYSLIPHWEVSGA